MEEYERQFMADVIESLSVSIASGMRECEEEFVESKEGLTDHGRLYVRGYLTARLSMLRSAAVGNPNLTADDVDQITSLVEDNEAKIAAQLYS
ncbi:MAG: hypothetical protein ABEJ28_03570 [Salinigranum sp.]